MELLNTSLIGFFVGKCFSSFDFFLGFVVDLVLGVPDESKIPLDVAIGPGTSGGLQPDSVVHFQSV